MGKPHPHTGSSPRRSSNMPTNKRASMREGPLAALFRKTAEDAPGEEKPEGTAAPAEGAPVGREETPRGDAPPATPPATTTPPAPEARTPAPEARVPEPPEPERHVPSPQ